jgi:DNA-binding LacI/PurR family transcriptional regulator
MAKKSAVAKRKPRTPNSPPAGVPRIARPLSLVAQVEQILREAIGKGRFAGDRLPTEVELADQLGVSRETVRRATETLQREGLVVKFRRKGTFTQPPALTLADEQPAQSTLLGYLQADYPDSTGHEEAVTRAISGLMLQGAIEEAGKAGFELIVRRSPHPAQMSDAFQRLSQGARLRGLIFASYGEEKLVRHVAGLGIPTVLLDHDLPLPKISTVRDDSFEGARQSVKHLADLGHRRIAFVHWHRMDLNPWRVMGYRQGLRDAKLPRRRSWELPTELTEAGARQVVERLVALSPRPTAVMTFNNTQARQLIEVLPQFGLRVPQDISVLGGGGEEIPGMTCYQADWYGLGQRAVQTLLRALKSKDSAPPEHHLFQHTLRKGQTTAPPPA